MTLREKGVLGAISIHALREEGDPPLWGLPENWPYFYPRPPRGGRRGVDIQTVQPPRISIHALREEGDPRSRNSRAAPRYFYPRPPRGGRQSAGAVVPAFFYISIHALREEGDLASMRCAVRASNFYPRPPRGGRPINSLLVNGQEIFLSTPSARRATLRVDVVHHGIAISIHALREEGDHFCSGSCLGLDHFYPRPPRGGRLQRWDM